MADIDPDIAELLGASAPPAVDPMALSTADRQKIVSWLESKTKSAQCPVCHTTSWTVGEHILHGQISSPDGALRLGGTSYPMAFVVCDNCFYVRTFMAVPMDLDFGKKVGGDV